MARFPAARYIVAAWERLILLVLAVIALFMILSAVISALHFLFWVAVVALLVFAGLRLAGGARRRSRR